MSASDPLPPLPPTTLSHAKRLFPDPDKCADGAGGAKVARSEVLVDVGDWDVPFFVGSAFGRIMAFRRHVLGPHNRDRRRKHEDNEAPSDVHAG